MGATNFANDNRCVVVTDEDYEFDNIPERGEYISNDYFRRNYPTYTLEDYSDLFKFHDIVISAGHYEGGCIDFVEKWNVDDIEYYIGNLDYYICKCDFIKEVKAEFCISTYRINKLCGNIKDFGGDFEAWINNAYNRVTEYLKEKEAEKCNEVIDQIRDKYGYEEYYTAGRFSDGTCLYKKVG